jgi:hypothetical protein
MSHFNHCQAVRFSREMRANCFAREPPRISGSLVSEMFQSAVQQVTGPSSVPVVTSLRTSQVVGVNLDEFRERPPERPAAETETVEVDTKESEKPHAEFAGFVSEVWLYPGLYLGGGSTSLGRFP